MNKWIRRQLEEFIPVPANKITLLNQIIFVFILLMRTDIKILLSERFWDLQTHKYFPYLFYKIICSHKQDHGFVLLSPIQFHLFTIRKRYFLTYLDIFKLHVVFFTFSHMKIKVRWDFLQRCVIGEK